MINDAFLAEQADHFASRVEQMTPVAGDPVELAFRLALARRPSPAEIATCRTLLANQAQRYRTRGDSLERSAHEALIQLCLTLLNTSEFLYAE